jgi:hypothetical protein
MFQEDNLYLSLALLPLEESIEIMPPHRPEAASTVAVSRVS